MSAFSARGFDRRLGAKRSAVGTAMTVLLGITILPSHAAAQIVILASDEKIETVIVTDTPNPIATAHRRAEARATQSWRQLAVSDECGYATVWAATDDKGTRVYFPVVGQATGKAAVVAASDQARAYVSGKRGWDARGASGVFRNTNKYALDAPGASPRPKPCAAVP